MIAATGVTSVHPIDIHSGHVDSADGSYPNRDLDQFPTIPGRSVLAVATEFLRGSR